MSEIENEKDGLILRPVPETIVALHNYFGKIFAKESNEEEYFKDLISQSQELLVEDILMAPSVLEITSDYEIIKHALATCKHLTVIGDGSTVKINAKPEQNTIILRDIPDFVALEDIYKIFTTAVGPDGNTSCPPVLSAKCENNHWFVTFATEEEAKAALICIRESKFENRPIKSRLKTESSAKSFFSGNHYQPHNNSNNNNSNISNGMSPVINIQTSEFSPVLPSPGIYPPHIGMVHMPYGPPIISGNAPNVLMGPSGGMFYGAYPILPPLPYAGQNFAMPGVGMPMGYAPMMGLPPNSNASDILAMQQQHMQMQPPNIYPFPMPVQQPAFIDINSMPYNRPPVAVGGRDFNPRNNNIVMNNMNNNTSNNINNNRQYNGNYNSPGGTRTNYSPPYNSNQPSNGPRQSQHLNNNNRNPRAANYNNGSFNNRNNNSYNNYHNNSSYNNNGSNINNNGDKSSESPEQDIAVVSSSELVDHNGFSTSGEDVNPSPIAAAASVESQQNYNNSNERNNNQNGSMSSHSWENSNDRKPRSQYVTADNGIKGSWSSDNNSGGNHHSYIKHNNQYSSNSSNSTSNFNGNNSSYGAGRQQSDGINGHQFSNNNPSDDSDVRNNLQSGRSNSRNRRTDSSNSSTANYNAAPNKGNTNNTNPARNKVTLNNRSNGASDGGDASNSSTDKNKSTTLEGAVAPATSSDSVADKTASKPTAESGAAESRINGQKGTTVRTNNKNAGQTGGLTAVGGKDKRDLYKDRDKSGRRTDRKDKKGQDSEADKTKKVNVELNFESDFPTLIDNDCEIHPSSAAVRATTLGYANAVRKAASSAEPPVDLTATAAIPSTTSNLASANAKQAKATQPNKPNPAPTSSTTAVNTSTDLDSPLLNATTDSETPDNKISHSNGNNNITQGSKDSDAQETITFGAFSEPVLVSDSDAVHFGPHVVSTHSDHTPPLSNSPKAAPVETAAAAASNHSITTISTSSHHVPTAAPVEKGFDSPHRHHNNNNINNSSSSINNEKASTPTKFGAGKSFSEIVRQQNKA